jgi:tripartite-type tricarboxylate transporter receptor subunit TctC
VRLAKPDGNTILMTTSAIVVEPVITGKWQDVARDLQPLALAVRSSLVMVARPGLAQRSFTEVQLALRNGTKLSCGHGGGTMLLACSALKQLNPDAVVLVPYASGALSLPDVAGDRLDVAFTVLESSVKALASSHKLRLLGRTHVGSSDPLVAALPRLDTLMPQLAVSPWLGWFTPIGTPPELTQRFMQAAREVLGEPDMLKRIDELDFRVDYTPEPDFSALLKSEYQRYTKLMAAPEAAK